MSFPQVVTSWEIWRHWSLSFMSEWHVTDTEWDHSFSSGIYVVKKLGCVLDFTFPPFRVLFETERLWHTMRILVKGLRPDTIQSTRQKFTAHKDAQNVVTYCSLCFTYTGTYLKRKRKNVNNYNKCKTDTVYHKVNEPAGWSKWHLLWHLRKAPTSNPGKHICSPRHFFFLFPSVRRSKCCDITSGHPLPSISFKIHHLLVILIIRRYKHIDGPR